MRVYVVEMEDMAYDNLVILGIYADRRSAEIGIQKNQEFEKEMGRDEDDFAYAIIPQEIIRYH